MRLIAGVVLIDYGTSGGSILRIRTPVLSAVRPHLDGVWLVSKRVCRSVFLIARQRPTATLHAPTVNRARVKYESAWFPWF